MAGNMIYIPELDGRVNEELIQKEFSQVSLET
jgi:hypothetical protein